MRCNTWLRVPSAPLVGACQVLSEGVSLLMGIAVVRLRRMVEEWRFLAVWCVLMVACAQGTSAIRSVVLILLSGQAETRVK